MKIKITRIDKSLPLPRYQTDGSVGFDLYAREETRIAPKSIALIPANVIVEVPDGYMLVIVTRSSTPKRKGLVVPHGIVILDRDYCGPNDEALIQVYNITDNEVIVERGERIGQGVFVKVGIAEWEELDEAPRSKTRGGFGSTGR